MLVVLSVAATLTALLAPSTTRPLPLAASPRRCASPVFLATKKKKKKKPAAPSAAGGFGAEKPLPPTFEEVVAGWKTRLPKDKTVGCACGLEQSYATCCQPYHQGDKAPETTEWCLRSRYTAFAYRLPEYIIRTTDKTNSDFMTDKIKWARKLNKEQMFDSFKFVGLEVGEREEGETEDEEFLSLRVSLMPVDAAGIQKQPEPMVFSERSRFVKRKGAWQYAAGEVTTEAAGFKDRVLNSQQDLEGMQKDVDYVKSIIKEKADSIIEEKMPKMPEMPWDKK